MSELKQSGKLIQILDVQAGTSKAGKEWQKRDFVIETQDQFPKKIAFSMFGDKIDMIEQYKIGDILNVSFNLESREYNGKWYHNVNAWRIESIESAASEQSQNNAPDMGSDEPGGDLPF